MTTPRRPDESAGYRRSLPPANDRLARPWSAAVVAIFVLMVVLAFAGFPSSLVPEATPTPLPSTSESVAPSGSGSAEPSGTESVAPSGSASESASASASASETAGASASPSVSGSESPAP